MIKYHTEIQWVEAGATQTQMYHIFYVRVMTHWNNLEWNIKWVLINSFFT